MKIEMQRTLDGSFNVARKKKQWVEDIVIELSVFDTVP